MRPCKCPVCGRQPVRVKEDIPYWPKVLYYWKCDRRDHYCSSEPFSDKEDAILNWNSLVGTRKCVHYEDDHTYTHDLNVIIK